MNAYPSRASLAAEARADVDMAHDQAACEVLRAAIAAALAIARSTTFKIHSPSRSYDQDDVVGLLTELMPLPAPDYDRLLNDEVSALLAEADEDARADEAERRRDERHDEQPEPKAAGEMGGGAA